MSSPEEGQEYQGPEGQEGPEAEIQKNGKPDDGNNAEQPVDVAAAQQKLAEMGFSADETLGGEAGPGPAPGGGVPQQWPGQYPPPGAGGANFGRSNSVGGEPPQQPPNGFPRASVSLDEGAGSRMSFAGEHGPTREPWEMPEVRDAVGEGGIFGPVETQQQSWAGAAGAPPPAGAAGQAAPTDPQWAQQGPAPGELPMDRPVGPAGPHMGPEGQHYPNAFVQPQGPMGPGGAPPNQWNGPPPGMGAPPGPGNFPGNGFPGTPDSFNPGGPMPNGGYGFSRPGGPEGAHDPMQGMANVVYNGGSPWGGAEKQMGGGPGQSDQGNPSSDPAYRTKLCAHWHAGKCQYGDRCIFAHGVSELRSFGDPDTMASSDGMGGGGGEESSAGMASENPAYRTQICTRWMEGSCQYGDRCNFAHGEDQLRQFGGPGGGSRFGGDIKSRSNDPAYRTKLCTRWAQGSCQYGDRCMFAHGEEQMRAFGGDGAPHSRRSSASENSDPAYRTKLCTRWLQGSCQYGDRCNFAHGEEQLRSYGSPHPSPAKVSNDQGPGAAPGGGWGNYPPINQAANGHVEPAQQGTQPQADTSAEYGSPTSAAKDRMTSSADGLWSGSDSGAAATADGAATSVRAVVCKMQHSPAYLVQVVRQYFAQFGEIENVAETPEEQRCQTTFPSYHCDIRFGSAAAAHSAMLKPRHLVAGHTVILLTDEEASPSRPPLSLSGSGPEVDPRPGQPAAASGAEPGAQSQAQGQSQNSQSKLAASVSLGSSDQATSLEFRPPGYAPALPGGPAWTASLLVPAGTFKESATAHSSVLPAPRKPIDATLTTVSHVMEFSPPTLLFEQKVTLSLPIDRKFPSDHGLQILWLRNSSEGSEWEALQTTVQDHCATALVEGLGDFVVTATTEAVTKADAADVGRWLTGFGMEAFAENIITEGVSNLALLRSLEERDVNEIMDEQGMQRMQKRVFKREWFRLKESPPQKFMA